MPDDSSAASSQLIIPDDIQKQFADVIGLIIHSESMNDTERQYWINILPIMTPEQLANLREILTTERTQLAAIDAQYAKAIDKMGQQEFVKQVGEERARKSAVRTQAETSAKSQEDQTAEDLLKHIEKA
ncbi:hypothetical protein HZA45_03555 [Candidatus Peregrinibacteria bacterium]|nr:hypothetical protein [Candidatus Peregrinibacteria bacterium]